MMYDNPQLAKAIFDEVGSRLLRYYEIILEYDTVGVLMHTDDWGFKTGTFLNPQQMQEYVYPWHKKIVEAAHAKKIPTVLHSCGKSIHLMDDIIDYLGYDGRHSYEDVILPVEDFHERWQGRIPILGGIDMDYLCVRSEGEIAERCRKLLQQAEGRGGLALGSGNSIPEYIPQDHYIALLKAALEY
jgi:uroporphyrinogen decarboxylase